MLPKAFRESLNVSDGARVVYTIEDSGKVTVEASSEEPHSVGVLKHLASEKPISLEDMDAAITKGIKQSLGL